MKVVIQVGSATRETTVEELLKIARAEADKESAKDLISDELLAMLHGALAQEWLAFENTTEQARDLVNEYLS